MTSWATVDVPA